MNLNSYMPVKLITGAGCVRSSGKELAKLGKKCLIVTGRSSAKACGALTDVTETLDANGQTWLVFDRIGPNPKLTDCMAAADKAIAADVDFILGIGGGSPLDAAKCIAVLAANPGMTQEQLYVFDWANAPLKIAAVGTTAGTGSEVTQVSVMNCGEEKMTINNPVFMPTAAVIDPELMLTVPPRVTMVTGLDALSHALEGYWSVNHQPLTDLYAIEAVRFVLNNLEKAFLDGSDKEARCNMAYAALLAGLAFGQPKTAGSHACSYPLSMDYHLPLRE